MSITLQRSAIDSMHFAEADAEQHAWILKVDATSTTEGLESEIFVFDAAMGDDPYQGDTPACVASLSQMMELPKDAPTVVEDGAAITSYRKSSVTYVCRSAEEAEELWEKIQEDVKDLSANFAALQNLTPTEQVTIP